MSEKSTVEPTRGTRGSGRSVPLGPRLGLVAPGPRGLTAAGGLAAWLLDAATRTDLTVDVADLGAHAAGTGPIDPSTRDRDGYVLLVGQYGATPAPAVEDVVTRHAARWAGRPVGLVAYGGVSRGRDAAAAVRRTLSDLGATVVVSGLGVNVAQLRGSRPSAFERVAWEMVLDDVAAACVRAAAAP